LAQGSINSRIGIIGMTNQKRQRKTRMKPRSQLINNIKTTKMKDGQSGRMAKIYDSDSIGEGGLYISEMDLEY
jgi:hypothetical protein